MKIYFIGIGGIGTSALAQYYLAKGYKVIGSDAVYSEIIEKLKQTGAKVFIGPHKKENIPLDADLVVFSPAVKEDNPEYQQAKKKKIKLISYPEALGRLTREYFTIAVSGTHGKSTTSSLIALILIKAGLDPTVIIGTKLKEFNNSNFRSGKSQYLIIEADEWKASFLNYRPKIIVLTNIEREHLDYYKNLEHVLKTFRKYIDHLAKNGFLIVNRDDKNIKKIIKSKIQIKNYSIKQIEAEEIRRILKIPGKHNIYNGLAALTLARVLKIPDKISFEALSQYRGAWRRFEEKDLKIRNYKLKIISDYGHHPTEIKATLLAAREKFPDKTIWCVFQPHQYQRTYFLFKDFVKVFSEMAEIIDKLIIADIFDVMGREKGDIKKKVSSEFLVEKINRKNVIYLTKEKAKDYLINNLKGGEIIIIMGAGDIYKLFNDIC